MALNHKRISKKLRKQEQKIVDKARKTLSCKLCGVDVENISADIVAVTCSRCCIKMSAPPDLPAKPKPPEERRPRGWQFMSEYRAPDGILYRRGEIVDETLSKATKVSAKRPRIRASGTTTTKEDHNGSDRKVTTGKRNRDNPK